MMITHIVAAAQNNTIGTQGDLPGEGYAGGHGQAAFQDLPLQGL